MKKILPVEVASKLLIAIFSLTIVFHVLIITRIIPFDMSWGGRLKGTQQIIVFESVSISLNIMMLLMVCIHAGYVKIILKPVVHKLVFFGMTALFILNTIGNLSAINPLEKIIFTPITLLLSTLCLRLAVENPHQHQHTHNS